MENTVFYQVFKFPIEATIGLAKMIYLFYLLSHPDALCDEKSSAYQYAHSLSAARLEQMYLDFKMYADKGVTFDGYRMRGVKPPEFSDLEYTRLFMYQHNIDNGTASMRLRFCFDQSIDIELKGINSDQPVIKLAWGELKRSEEVLWRLTDDSE